MILIFVFLLGMIIGYNRKEVAQWLKKFQS